jgi:putative phosphoribosyl transferase
VADEVVCLKTPDSFGAVGAFYLDFTQTSDEEALTLLREAQLSAITAAGSQPGLQVRHQPTRP